MTPLPTITILWDSILTFVIGMLPIMEAKGAIIYGVSVLKLAPWIAFVSGTLGNMVACAILIQILEPITLWMRQHSKRLDSWVEWIFDHTRTKHKKMMGKIGHIALLLWVAAPLPGTGGWSGSLIAHVFGVNKKLAFWMIETGTLISGILVFLGTKGIVHFF
jgi:uncharacterized membrane protein